MIGLLIRPLAAFLQSLPIAVAAAVVVAAIAWAVWKQERIRLQLVLIAAAFGLCVGVANFDLFAGGVFAKAGFSSNLGFLPEIVGANTAGLTLAASIWAAMSVSSRKVLTPVLLAVAYGAAFAFTLLITA